MAYIANPKYITELPEAVKCFYGRRSNGNVVVELTPLGYTTVGCKVCKVVKQIEGFFSMSSIDEGLDDFCQEHRHDCTDSSFSAALNYFIERL